MIDEPIHTDGVDDEGRRYDEPIAVTFSRAGWTLIRNQLANAADDWARSPSWRGTPMADKIRWYIDQIDDRRQTP